MTEKMTVACVQLNSGSDMAANIAQIDRLVRTAHEAGAQLIALPENAYLMRGSDQTTPMDYTMDSHPGLAHAKKLAQELACWLLIGSVFVMPETTTSCGRWVNRSVLINPSGGIGKLYDKIHLFDADFGDGECYRESDRFMPGAQAQRVDLPCGKLGMTVCYDLRFAHLFRDLTRAGATILSIPAAFTRRTGEAHWHPLLRARAIENGCYVIAPAQCGSHPGGRQTFGHSMIIDPWGIVLAEAGQEMGFILAEIDPQRVEAVRRQLPVLQHEREYGV